jgi:hypothetical protein
MSKEMKINKVQNFGKFLNEIYSDKDMKRGEELGKTSFGIDVKFKDDFRRDKLIIKKLVRLKSKINDENIKSEIDNILDLLEGTNDEQGAF